MPELPLRPHRPRDGGGVPGVRRRRTMKPHPRIRKTVKWGGAAVTVLLVVLWIGSGWCAIGFQVNWNHVWVDGGTLKFGTLDATYGHGWVTQQRKTQASMSWHRWAWQPIGNICVRQGFPRW